MGGTNQVSERMQQSCRVFFCKYMMNEIPRNILVIVYLSCTLNNSQYI